MLSRSAEYAISALTYLADQPRERWCGAQEIAAATDIPLSYLWKILRQLRDDHLLLSYKGMSGGYRLARKPNRITIDDVLAAVSEERPSGRCFLMHSECDEKHPCPVHKPWVLLRKRLDRTTVADLIRLES